jgi:uncharacterized protein (DUF305 family)
MDTVQANTHDHIPSSDKTYSNLLWMGLLHLPIMYIFMFAMVDTWDSVEMNLNTFYMALMMAAPMLIVMPLMMKDMYKDKTKNLFVFMLASILLLSSFLMIRKQTLISDNEFVRSMVPHHSGAILMCEQANLSDTELRSLCTVIVKAQRKEIYQLKQIQKRLDSKLP